jgi:hypothetical protein
MEKHELIYTTNLTSHFKYVEGNPFMTFWTIWTIVALKQYGIMAYRPNIQCLNFYTSLNTMYQIQCMHLVTSSLLTSTKLAFLRVPCTLILTPHSQPHSPLFQYFIVSNFHLRLSHTLYCTSPLQTDCRYF